ncbi:MAG: multidrug effflux MFS transporter [Proteobacteria bacterium]|nr:multidrug effflux MFS transporter [Pseudomonadota bacterium]
MKNTVVPGKQKYLKGKGMLVMLAFISVFPPISTDLYLPALPQMMEVLKTSQVLVNLTLSLFFVFFAIGILFWGPLSEKYGRKPILIIGLVMYSGASILCALAQNINQLIFFRVLQAFGGGAATAVATAIVKDIYSGKKREDAIALVMAMVIVAPVIAPILGALLLEFTSWRAIFWTLSGVGGLAIVATGLLQETLEKQYNGSIVQSLGRLWVVIKNPGFSSLLLTFSLSPIAMLAFIAASSYIYIQGFGLNERSFSFYFSLNAIFAMFGPLLYIRISKLFKSQTIITSCFITLAMSGFMVSAWGHTSPLLFAITMIPATMSITAMRPPSANLMLEQQKYDSGSASSLINFFGMVMGSLGMMLISFNWKDLISTLGIIQIIIGIAGGGLWLLFRNKPFIQFTASKDDQ